MSTKLWLGADIGKRRLGIWLQVIRCRLAMRRMSPCDIIGNDTVACQSADGRFQVSD